MIRIICVVYLLLLISLNPEAVPAQARGAQTPQTGQPGAPARPSAKPPAKPQPPLTLRQVIESLSSLRNTTRVEALISTRGVQFEGSPAVLDMLKEFGAGPKLISMIPVPPPPPPPPAPKVAGPLTVVCEPKDCTLIVDDSYKGPTSENRQTVTGLLAGEVTVNVFADGYESVSRRIKLMEEMPLEERFSLKRSDVVREQSASASLLKAVASLGGIDGMVELADIEGTGMVHWLDSAGQTQEWAMTFNKRIGKDLAMTFRSTEGQCSASIQAQSVKQECRSGLKNGGEKIAEQATSLFLSYQPQDVIQALIKRPLLASDTDENLVESSDGKDSYALTLGSNSLPVDLVYRIGDANAPIQVQYSNYVSLNNSRYPGRIEIGRLNNSPVWIFTVTSVRSRPARAR